MLTTVQIFVELIIIHLEVHFVPFVQTQDHVGGQAAKVFACYIKIGVTAASALQSGQVEFTFVQFHFRQDVIDLAEGIFVQFQNEVVANVADRAVSVVRGPVDVVVWRLLQQPFQEFPEVGYYPQSAKE